MKCSTVCAASVGAMTAVGIIGGTYDLLPTPVLVAFRHQPEIQEEILNKWLTVCINGITVGSHLGTLAVKAARFAYYRITANQ